MEIKTKYVKIKKNIKNRKMKIKLKIKKIK